MANRHFFSVLGASSEPAYCLHRLGATAAAAASAAAYRFVFFFVAHVVAANGANSVSPFYCHPPTLFFLSTRLDCYSGLPLAVGWLKCVHPDTFIVQTCSATTLFLPCWGLAGTTPDAGFYITQVRQPRLAFCQTQNAERG